MWFLLGIPACHQGTKHKPLLFHCICRGSPQTTLTDNIEGISGHPSSLAGNFAHFFCTWVGLVRFGNDGRRIIRTTYLYISSPTKTIHRTHNMSYTWRICTALFFPCESCITIPNELSSPSQQYITFLLTFSKQAPEDSWSQRAFISGRGRNGCIMA